MRTKITPCPTMGYDAKGTEKVLGEMSRKGWILKKAGTLWRYEEAEPKERAFSVVFTRPQEGWSEDGESDELRNIVDYAESLGWQRISSHNDRGNNNISIFMNEDTEAEPLDTDDSVHLMNTKRTMGKKIRGFAINMIVISMYSFLGYFNTPEYPGFEKPTWQLYIGILDILLGLTVLAGYLLWLRRAKKALSMGREIPDMLKYTNLLRCSTILVLVLWFAVILSQNGGPLALLIILIFILGFWLAGKILTGINESDSQGKKIVLTFAAVIIAMAGLFTLLYFVTR